MNKEIVREVVEAMVAVGIVDVECGIPTEEAVDEVVEATHLKVIELKHDREMQYITTVLKDFKEYIESDSKLVIQDGVKREMTLTDYIDFIRSEWLKVEDALIEEVGICLDELE